ncbi:MAG: acyltransferase family protein [Caulobacter sp.]|nr:acyltransferase family protein [Caulobacter sp.]
MSAPPPAPVPSSTGRRADLDWLRIVALALLILYHVGLAYTPWDWHLNSAHRFAFMEKVILLTSPWRLTLLFLVSGAALRLMSGKYPAREVLRQRFLRLAPPFIFGVLVLIPPQAWVEAMAKYDFHGGLIAWWLQEFSLDGLARGIPINHLWFVLYIGVYSLVAVALLFRPAWIAAAELWLKKTLTGWRLLVLPILYLAAIRQLLYPWFGLTNRLESDWYNHALSLGVFLFGFLMVRRASLWSELERVRWIAAPAAAVSVIVLMILYGLHRTDLAGASLRNSVFAFNQWMTIVAALGFASRHLRGADGPARRYLNDAIFPCYLAHQTITVVALYLLLPHHLPPWIEAPVLVGVTLGGSLAIYEVVRRINLIRPLWGLKPLPRSAPPATPRSPGKAAP